MYNMMWAPEGRQKRGRPRTTWKETAEKERERAAWRTWSDVHVSTAVANRAGWRHSVEALCTIWQEEVKVNP